MGKFEDIWVLLLPEAEELRRQALTPQEICTRLAVVGFGNKDKYNTVKGWYKRKFKDWPEDNDEVQSMGSRRRYSDIPPPLEAYHLWQMRSRYPQSSQTYSHNSQNILEEQQADATSQPTDNLPPRGTGISLEWTQNAPTYGLPEELVLYESQAASRRPSRQELENNQMNNSHPGTFSNQSFQPHQPWETQYESTYGSIAQPSFENDSSQHRDDLRSSRVVYPPQKFLERRDETTQQYARESRSHQEGISFQQVIYTDLDQSVNGFSTNFPICDTQWSPGPGDFENLLSTDSDADIVQHDDTTVLMRASATSCESMTSGSYVPHTPPMPSVPPTSGSVLRPSDISLRKDEVDHSIDQQHEPNRMSTKHHRISSTFSDPTMPPQYSLPPDPPRVPAVVRRRADQTVPTPWKPVYVEDSKIVAVDPQEFPTAHPRKLVKRQLRDSIGIYHDQRETPSIAPTSTTDLSGTAPDTSRKPLRDQPVNPSNASIRSSIRDSGYISSVESVWMESMRNSFSSLQLEDPKFKTTFSEDDDGYVHFKFKAKCSVRKSYIARLEENQGQVNI
ncbi:uncharacterized protein LY89DRAFT_498666 [Mollisia scopiformis]|uniref:Uncharacterized protein n=1 Tax=Mollisia scopiformis TaxID=149040 RepID=A0A194XEF6_MOLSC|nr:uncharacterized protein LY89DRAFT_498666 [Mollisia scopiformis]KUJ18529.1 hypothetical protein LY89DRAFT_498666 [Mollisia scopiformis]